ncbi:MAG: peptidoglycan bridge formation glycyltransferase FemA/FemB family protein [Candidatus Microsaccharimonas sossegonensis]|uniref:Peptidoglycan bridge formation glycyltransferase FemA/FemB family protein n=1 Tax=Candidatus Microsaccharimonas sossegonensis TaxID=2506948 RepID=A0A4Q0AID2_9BACT|nr:MAG: peptidoglycan bridge formation glycyltransferase FemA/FemB family protein [Candidatus Microsaccharimonas sossegonensis]
MIELKKCVDKERWDEYILEHEGHPLQLWGWGQVKSAHGWTAERVFAVTVENENELVGAAQILIRKLPLPFRSFAYIPRGPTIDETLRHEFLEKIVDLIKREYRSVALSIEPNSIEFDVRAGWKKSTNKILPPTTILLDISRSESDLLADMAKKTRQYIRKSAAEGITIKRVRTKDELEECLHIYRQTADRAKFNLHKGQYYLDVYNLMGDHSPIFVAYLEGVPIAFLWIAISADTAYELYGGMNEDGQRLRANYALKWHVIRKVKEWGLTRYDFGGLVVGGVSIFKQGWATKETSFAGTFEKALSPTYSIWSKVLPKAKRILQKTRR